MLQLNQRVSYHDSQTGQTGYVLIILDFKSRTEAVDVASFH